MSFFDRLKSFPYFLLPKRALTRMAGRWANCINVHQWAIRRFIRHYNVNMAEAVFSKPEDYQTFNAFFTRALKASVRPINSSRCMMISPVDGTVAQYGQIKCGRIIQAKGHDYSVSELIAEADQPFTNGQFVTLYLAPGDYHRVHMPIDGELCRSCYIPGRLLPVKPCVAETVPRLFARNERLVMHFESTIGPLVVVMIGAMIVSGIATNWSGAIGRHSSIQHWQYPQGSLTFAKGETLGHFALGSTVVVLLADGSVGEWQCHLQQQMRMGEGLIDLNDPT